MSFNDDEFADFQNCTFEQDKTEINSIDDDEFADFQDANFVNNDNQNLINNDVNNKLNDNLKFEIILKDAFPDNQFEQSINDDKQIIILKDLFIDENKKNLWTQIQNLKESPSLKLKWNKTHSFQNFLSSLKINPKNMFNPHVPIFASSSTIHFGELLEPTKLNNNEHISSINSINCKQELNSTNLDNLSIKQNDKNSSQLEINSLNNFNNINQINYNLDKGKTDQPNGLIKSTSDKLINNIKKVPDNQKKKDELTESNNKILDELPILNFMRSDRIMFNH